MQHESYIMMAMKLILLVLVAGSWGFTLQPLGKLEALNATLTCGKYQCASSTLTQPNNTCVQVQNGINNLWICSPLETTFCNTTSLKCQAKPVVAVSPSWPGEPCSTTAPIRPCQFGACQLGKCKGMFSGGPCTAHDQCDIGLRCNRTGLCSPQIAAKGVGCLSQYDCVNTAECNETSTVSGTCVVYGSLAVGSIVTDCLGGQSRMCKSNTCKSDSLFTKIGQCVEAAMSVNAAPQLCTSSTDCVGSNGVNFFISTCKCGYNPAGAAFCSPFMGDPVGVAYINQWMKALTASQGVCNTMRRFSNSCLNITGKTGAIAQASYLYHQYASIQANDNCIKYSYTSAYWEARGFLLAAASLFLLI